MFFFFKRKKVVVDCFTPSKSVYDLTPIKPTVHYFPDWWKSMPKEYVSTNDIGIEHNFSTIKRCVGITDLYKTGFVVPFWSDLVIETKGGFYKYEFSNNSFKNDYLQNITTHTSKQLCKEFDNYIHIKIVAPWLLKEKTGVKFLLSQPFWNNVDKWEKINIVPGVVDYRLAKQTNVNAFLSRGSHRRIEFKHNTPLVQIIPMTEKEVITKTHLVSTEEYEKILFESGYTISFKNRYKNTMKLMKENKKCPFS